MGILRDFEKRLEGAVEGFFARAFRSGLQPVELAKAIQRYAGNYQQVAMDGVYVPNHYRFEMSADDLERFSGFESSLRRELADVVRRIAADRGWRLKGPVRIELRERPELRVGTYELRGKVAAEPTPPPGQPQPVKVVDERAGSTQVLQPDAPPKAGWIHVLNGAASGQRFPLKDTTIVGRLPECDITLDDPSVSRRHVRITRPGGQWRVEDLGSTNGLRVNGEQVPAAELRDGDRLELGTMRLAFAEER
jgi:hypothetical protein